MIGNSHIDPVWFWDWEEGLQEVKATFSAAIDRLREYPKYYWFYESTREAVVMAKDAAVRTGLHGMPCCFGAGNHGGGSTIRNIEAIYTLREEFPKLMLTFSGYHDFFDQLTDKEKESLPVKREFLDRVNHGCYAMDSELKRKNRQAER